MLNNNCIKLRVGSELYRVVFDPFVNDKPEWFIKKYIIRDLYYSDSCYAILENCETHETEVHQMVDELLATYFYTEEYANSYIYAEKNSGRIYAWGRCTEPKRD